MGGGGGDVGGGGGTGVGGGGTGVGGCGTGVSSGGRGVGCGRGVAFVGGTRVGSTGRTGLTLVGIGTEGPLPACPMASSEMSPVTSIPDACTHPRSEEPGG